MVSIIIFSPFWKPKYIWYSVSSPKFLLTVWVFVHYSNYSNSLDQIALFGIVFGSFSKPKLIWYSVQIYYSAQHWVTHVCTTVHSINCDRCHGREDGIIGITCIIYSYLVTQLTDEVSSVSIIFNLGVSLRQPLEFQNYV